MGSPSTMTSTMPPRVSPDFLAASMQDTMPSSASLEYARTGDASIASMSAYVGAGPAYGADSPIEITCENTSTPNVSRSSERATVAAATRAAVSRAEERSRTGRAESNPYLSMPAKSAWPGRGRVRRAPRPDDIAFATSSSSMSSGCGDMIVVHFAHSELPI